MQAVYDRERDGDEPVKDFIDGLAPERQEEIDYKIGLLNRLGNSDPPLPFPHGASTARRGRSMSPPPESPARTEATQNVPGGQILRGRSIPTIWALAGR